MRRSLGALGHPDTPSQCHSDLVQAHSARLRLCASLALGMSVVVRIDLENIRTSEGNVVYH